MESPSSISIAQLAEVLDGKIREISMLKSLLTRELDSIGQGHLVRDRVFALLRNLDYGELREAVNNELQDYHRAVVEGFATMSEHYQSILEKTRLSYQREIYELETELQKQYRLTRSMKSEVEELKGLVDCFVREKQAKVKELEDVEPATSLSNHDADDLVLTLGNASGSCSSPSNSLPLIKAQNPILEIITE